MYTKCSFYQICLQRRKNYTTRVISNSRAENLGQATGPETSLNDDLERTQLRNSLLERSNSVPDIVSCTRISIGVKSVVYAVERYKAVAQNTMVNAESLGRSLLNMKVALNSVFHTTEKVTSLSHQQSITKPVDLGTEKFNSHSIVDRLAPTFSIFCLLTKTSIDFRK